MKKKSLIALALSTTTALALGACSDAATDSASDSGSDSAASEATVTVTESQSAESSSEDTASSEASSSSENSSESAPAPAGEDLAFAAIDAALAEYSDGIIVSVDREDNSDVYEIDVVSGNEVIELDVNATTGEIREDDRDDDDDDDIQEANAATKTAAEAIQEALDQHPDGVLDEAELDEDDGRLTWDIDLDDADRNDLAELEISAN